MALAVLTAGLAVVGSMLGALVTQHISESEATRSFARTQTLKDYTAFITAAAGAQAATDNMLGRLEAWVEARSDERAHTAFNSALNAQTVADDKLAATITQLHMTGSAAAYAEALKVWKADFGIVLATTAVQTREATQAAAAPYEKARSAALEQFVLDARDDLRP